MIKRYSELIELPTFLERYEYLKLEGSVGAETFGFDRYLNQNFYRTPEWRRVRDIVIIRDNGNDMAMDDYAIGGRIIIHHMNPITIEDLVKRREWVLDPENLISVSHNTHNAIHFGDENLLPKDLVIREPGDTCLWKRN